MKKVFFFLIGVKKFFSEESLKVKTMFWGMGGKVSWWKSFLVFFFLLVKKRTVLKKVSLWKRFFNEFFLVEQVFFLGWNRFFGATFFYWLFVLVTNFLWHFFMFIGEQTFLVITVTTVTTVTNDRHFCPSLLSLLSILSVTMSLVLLLSGNFFTNPSSRTDGPMDGGTTRLLELLRAANKI